MDDLTLITLMAWGLAMGGALARGVVVHLLDRLGR